MSSPSTIALMSRGLSMRNRPQRLTFFEDLQDSVGQRLTTTLTFSSWRQRKAFNKPTTGNLSKACKCGLPRLNRALTSNRLVTNYQSGAVD